MRNALQPLTSLKNAGGQIEHPLRHVEHGDGKFFTKMPSGWSFFEASRWLALLGRQVAINNLKKNIATCLFLVVSYLLAGWGNIMRNLNSKSASSGAKVKNSSALKAKSGRKSQTKRPALLENSSSAPRAKDRLVEQNSYETVHDWVLDWFRETFHPPIKIAEGTLLAPLHLGDSDYDALAQAFEQEFDPPITGAQIEHAVLDPVSTIHTVVAYLFGRANF